MFDSGKSYFLGRSHIRLAPKSLLLPNHDLTTYFLQASSEIRLLEQFFSLDQFGYLNFNKSCGCIVNIVVVVVVASRQA